MTKDIELNADELILALTDVRDHVTGRRKITMRTTNMALPPPVDHIRPEEVRAIRQRLKVSQAVFARLLNVPVVTEASWEAGRRNPSGAALRLLQIARKDPEVLLSSPEAISKKALRVKDRAVRNFKKGKASKPMELEKYL